ncbi:hypothetical protein ACHAW5_001670 [Stephanodiscus triporus]|uniref:SLC41A/MgtE integral membrane domain-containing protein n=1 Tax=Stephanodiscus triporus TaxID=2934178 RepID=A0ABD3NGD7_9STRA
MTERSDGTGSDGSNLIVRKILSLSRADDLESIFSDIRSEHEGVRRYEESCRGISNEAEEYRMCTPFKRAFPERSSALIVTLVFELPTLFIISGGSDQLCRLIGRRKYTTLISLLPLISAISGNVGLQASTLTTRAISHVQVRVDNYLAWLGKEIVVAAYLVVMSSIAFIMGGYSFPFALSIFFAQFIGIATAGLTGTLAPLLFTFIFKSDSGKWGGPLETAVQDVSAYKHSETDGHQETTSPVLRLNLVLMKGSKMVPSVPTRA